MYKTAELLLKSYKPLYLEKGQLFVRRLYPGSDRERLELWPLNKNIHSDEQDVFMLSNGAPVELFLIDMHGTKLATPNEIGWFDEGEHSDELHDITLDELNSILNNYGGFLEVDVDEHFVPIYEESKVIIRFQKE